MADSPDNKRRGKSPQDGCHNCRHWKSDNPESGECRRYPPTVILDSDDSLLCIWPQTDSTDGCGEHAGRLQ